VRQVGLTAPELAQKCQHRRFFPGSHCAELTRPQSTICSATCPATSRSGCVTTQSVRPSPAYTIVINKTEERIQHGIRSLYHRLRPLPDGYMLGAFPTFLPIVPTLRLLEASFDAQANFIFSGCQARPMGQCGSAPTTPRRPWDVVVASMSALADSFRLNRAVPIDREACRDHSDICR
jgi:hypothetical protein